MDPKIYAYLFVLLWILVPALTLMGSPDVITISWIILSVGSLVLTMRRLGGPKISYMEGLELLSRRFSSGCANITIIYIFPLLTFYHLMYTVKALIWIKKPKAFSQEKFAENFWTELQVQRAMEEVAR